MTGEEYRKAIETLGLSQVAAGEFLMASPRSSRRWAESGPPPLEAVVLELMVRSGLTPKMVRPDWNYYAGQKRGKPNRVPA